MGFGPLGRDALWSRTRSVGAYMLRVLLIFGLVVSPAAPLAVSFAPGLLGPAASAGPLLRRLRAVGVTHLAAVPQSDATVEHFAEKYTYMTCMCM